MRQEDDTEQAEPPKESRRCGAQARFAQVGLPEMPGGIGQEEEQGQVGIECPNHGTERDGREVKRDEAQQGTRSQVWQVREVVEGAVRNADEQQAGADQRP